MAAEYHFVTNWQIQGSQGATLARASETSPHRSR